MSAETNNQVILDQQLPTVGDSNDQQQPPSESQVNLDAPMTTVAASDACAPDQDGSNPEQDPLQESAQKTVQSIQSNQDYQAVVKVMNVLKHQLTRAKKDIETLTRMKKEALDDPFTFVLDLKSKKKMKRPPPRLQRILSVPEVDWTKYRFVPESRFARQTASLAALTHLYTSNVSKRPGMFKSILDHPSTLERGTMAVDPSKDVATLQQDLAKGLASVNALTASSSAVGSEASDPGGASDEDDGEQRSIPKSQRRVSSQTGGTTADKYIPSRSASSPGVVHPMKQRGTLHDVPTHNLPWSDEEQQRLEQLLEIYPDEPIQAQRFNKIAEAMGTRTARQVGSRIQKYFIKLAKMGLPIPGRLNSKPKPIKPKATSSAPASPASSTMDKRGRSKMRNTDSSRPKRIGYNSMISGGMTNSKISGAYYTTAMVPSVYMSEDEEIDDRVKKTMRRVANPSNDDTSSVQETVIHEGFACDSCGVEPIVGVLYKCTVCDEAEEVDLCSKCMALGTFTNDQHSLDHTFEAVRTAAPPYYADNDYASPEHLGEYSYLGY